MRIKKKHVLTEALLIDVTNEFTPTEKKIFKIFRKKFGEGGYAGGFDRWAGASWLIENMEYNHDEAYDLALTYWYNGDKLFDEVKTLRKKENKGYVFHRALNQYEDEFLEEKGEHFIGPITIKWEDPNNLLGNGNKFTSTSDTSLWSGYRGFNIYVPFEGDLTNYRTSYNFRETTVIFGRIKYTEVGKDKYDDPDTDYNKFYEVNFEIERKNIIGQNEIVFKEIERRNIPLPFNKKVIFDIITNDINKMVDILKNRTFVLPEEDINEE